MSNTRTVVNSHISKIAAKHRSGALLSRDDANYLIAAIGDLATETAQAEKEMETLRETMP